MVCAQPTSEPSRTGPRRAAGAEEAETACSNGRTFMSVDTRATGAYHSTTTGPLQRRGGGETLRSAFMRRHQAVKREERDASVCMRRHQASPCPPCNDPRAFARGARVVLSIVKCPLATSYPRQPLVRAQRPYYRRCEEFGPSQSLTPPPSAPPSDAPNTGGRRCCGYCRFYD